MGGAPSEGAEARRARIPAALVRWLTGRHRHLIILCLDTAFVCTALYLGFFTRFEGRIPDEYEHQFRAFLPILLAIRVPLFFLFGIHRWSFRLAGLYEAIRVILASLTGSACFVTVFFFTRRVGPPRSVVVIEFFVTTSLLGALRFSPRFAHTWLLGQMRSRSGARVRTLIVGAGSAGELLLRDLHRSDEHPYDIVGFVDDNPAKWGISIGGRPVLGSLTELPEVVRRRGVGQLLFAIPRLSAARIREVLLSCAELKLTYKILPVSFAYLNDRVTRSMLQELSPEDLLHRHQVRFDEQELRQLIEGRRVLVTGAGGSIGGEICRQVATYSPARLILADVNENDLYFLYRHLKQRYPDLEVRAEVADIREEARVAQLGRAHSPHDIFHAAGHKHVPLMEFTPEEAVKSNVIGCCNVAQMAAATGAGRFVLISTDKAVDPASVMGATKRVAEMVVRQFAERTSTVFTAVRFGNVLGSAGSVVPLFKAQIAAGGPVTVTHPDVRRYLMTVQEAVGLVLMAGLGGYGQLCILEMGQPIRILDLARLMITMAGRVPEEEVPIVFIGLRPGEKLDEALMTAEEAQTSRPTREMIRVIDGAPPPSDLADRIARLQTLAARGDRHGLVAALRELVPSYTPSALWSEPPTGPRGVVRAANLKTT